MPAVARVVANAIVSLRPDSDIHELARTEEPAASRIVTALLSAGVDTFFGVPGGAIAPICDAIGRVSGARMIESRHESSAAFEAASFYRLSGRVPALVTTAGPGITNAVTGIASAHIEGVPLVVLCGDVAWARRGDRMAQDSGPQGIGAEQMVAHLTRGTFRVPSARAAVSHVLAAFRRATDPRNPGPVLVVLPNDRSAASTSESRVELAAQFSSISEPSRKTVREIIEALAEARRPLVVLGAGARPFAPALRRIFDAFNVPFVTTPQGKGIVSERHPRSLRHGGLAASMWAREYTQAGVDVALVLGTDLDDAAIGLTPYIAPDGRLYHVDRDATVFQRNLPAHAGITADLGAFVRLFAQEIGEVAAIRREAAAFVRALRSKSPFFHPTARSDAARPIRPDHAVMQLQELAPPDTLFITDIGEHMLFALHYLTAEHEQHFHIHIGLGSMGSGIAGAVGVGLASPGRPVICICGDGGMQMSSMEILVAKQYELPIMYAVFNDQRYNMVYHGMKQTFGRTPSWQTPFVDFAAWARSMGIPSLAVDSPDQLSAGLMSKLLQSGGPSVLDLRIDRDVRIRGAGRVEALQQMQLVESRR